MKTKTKRIPTKVLSLFLSIMVLVSVLPAGMIQAQAATKMTLAELQAKFPSGKYWNHIGVNNWDYFTTTNKPCKHHGGCNMATGSCGCNCYDKSIQCMGFAKLLGYLYYGSNPITWTESKNLNLLKAGDVVRWGGHSFWVTSVNGDKVTYADCNRGKDAKLVNTCGIQWGNTITKAGIKARKYFFRSAPYALKEVPTSISNITTKDENNITNNSVKLNISISPKSSVEKIGLFYGTSKSAINSVTASTDHSNTSSHKYYLLYGNSNGQSMSSYSFDTAKKTTQNGYTVKFNAGTTYHYKIVVKIGGSWYISGRDSFTTKADKPSAVTGLKASPGVYATGEKPSIIWKAPNKHADYYKVYVYNKSNNIVEKNTRVVNPSYKVSKALNATGTYTVKVVASNEAGDSGEAFCKFTVKPDVIFTFNYNNGTGKSETRKAKYNKTITTPKAPTRTGYTFSGWKSGKKTVAANTNIDKATENATYTAVWESNKYNVRIVDGITNEKISNVKVNYGNTININNYVSENNITVPEHDNYEFIGFSEDNYTVNTTSTHTIYARYKWNSSKAFTTSITNIARAKTSVTATENDGYSVDVDITAPSVNDGGTAQTIKGRVVVALKTDAGRLLIETESAAFVIYPSQTAQTVKSINVFVPYESTTEALPTVIEAYVVNNYYTAGIISNVATNSSDLIAANSIDDWKYSAVEVAKGDVLSNGERVADVNHEKDHKLYTKTVTTTTESLNNELSGFNLLSKQWINIDGGYEREGGEIYYVKAWPTLGNKVGCKFDNTTGTGKTLYNTYNLKPVELFTEEYSRTTQTRDDIKGYIYYHWCRGYDTGNLKHVVKNNKKTTDDGYVYNTFETFYSTVDLPTEKYYSTEYFCARDNSSLSGKSKDSYYWFRFPVYRQRWWEDRKVYTFVKNEVSTVKASSKPADSSSATSSASKFTSRVRGLTCSLNLNTSVETKYTNEIPQYAYKAENTSISHEDKNIIEKTISGQLGAEYANKKAVIYIYKDNQVSDFTTEYIGYKTLDSDGGFSINNPQTREAISYETGDYTVAVSVEDETNAIVVDTIAAPKPTYTVKFITNTEADTDTGIQTEEHVISTQTVTAGDTAELPDEALIPEKEGYHFVGWSQSVVNVNDNLVVEAEYEKNEYAVVFVDWDNQNINIEKYNYGDAVQPLELPEVPEDTDVHWVIFDKDSEVVQTLEEYTDNGGVVTDDMVIAAEYSIKQVEVTALAPGDTISQIPAEGDEDDSDVDDNGGTKYEYGDIIQLDAYEDDFGDEIIFNGWRNAATGELLETAEVTEDMVIYPDFIYTETCDAPVASVTTGEYSSSKTVRLTCSTDNSSIYYTLDGSNPTTSSTAKKYNSLSGISVSSAKVLKFYAKADNMNDSPVVTELYAINSVLSTNKYHIVTVNSNIYQDSERETAYQTIIKEGSTLNLSVFNNEYGYNFNGLYYDEEFINRFDDANPVEEGLTLYASYSPKVYTATFVDSDGTTLATKTGQYLTSIDPPTVSAPNGFVFTGWDSYDYECIYENKTFTAQYTPEEEYTTVTIDRTEDLHLQNGSSKALSATFSTGNISLEEITWDSSDWSVARVDNEGVVTGVGVGEATISVTVDANDETAEVNVVVFNSKYDCTEHKEVIDKGYAATCTASGLTDGKHCELCDTVIEKQEVIAPLGHKYEVTVTESSCTNPGAITYTCSVCGASYTEYFGKAKGHNVVNDAAVAATFTSDGKTAGSHCSVCGEVITAQKPVAKLGSAELSGIKAAKKKFTATWKSVTDIDGYEIQYSLKKNMKKSKKKNVRGAAKSKLTVKKLKSKKTYYVRIRAYKLIDGKKVYSSWSAKKKVKTR